MKNRNPISSQEVYSLLKSYWHIRPEKRNDHKIQLRELGLSTSDINWMLNSIEWKYRVSIDTETVPLQSTIEEFVTEVTSHVIPGKN